MATSGKSKPPLVADKRRKATKPKSKPKRRTAKPKAKPTARKRGPIATFFRGVVRWVFRLIWLIFSRTAFVGAVILALWTASYYVTLPEAAQLVDARTRGSVTMLDRDGVVYAWRGDQFGGMIDARTVAPPLKNAVVATEDKRFYWHPGIDPRGIASAIKINMSEGRSPFSGNGGSTITQQTAKLLCLGVPFDADTWDSENAYEADCRRTTLWRKAKEAVYSFAMEARYSKDEILTIYLNRAYLGAGARGFEAAAQRYFGKSANEVDVAESAMLAGLLKAPSTYAPTANLKRSQDRGNVIIGLMLDQDYITPAQAQNARTNPARLSKAAAARAGGYFADWVLEETPSFLGEETTEDVIIHSTFDPKIQTAAEEALAYIFETKVRPGSEAQAAIVVMSADGAVRAMVGGRETKVSGVFNRATTAKRQTGSAFKPFVFGAALDLGFTPNATVVDEPWCIDVPGSGQYCPKNYTKDFKGRVTLTESLAQSLNVPAVRVSESVGRENVAKIAEGFGIESSLAQGPALALGASESNLLEMTGAYAGILNGGTAVTPYGMIELRLQGDEDAVVTQSGGLGERVMTDDAAKYLTYMMSRVVEGGTGARANLGNRPAAGKTGTTQAARDAWFIGFTADYVAGVWMGYDNNTPLTGVTGGGLPAEIWHETMTRVHEGLPVTPLPMLIPEPVKPKQVAEPKRQQRQQDPAERVLLDVLRNILGNSR